MRSGKASALTSSAGSGGSASIPPTGRLFWIALVHLDHGRGVLAAAAAERRAQEQRGTEEAGADREIARIPGIRAIFFVSVVTVAAQDLIVVYMPLLGSERGIAVDSVGMLLAVRADRLDAFALPVLAAE